MVGKPIRKLIPLDLNLGSMIPSTEGSKAVHIPIKSSQNRSISRSDLCLSWYDAILGLHGVKEDLRRGSKDLVRNIDSEGSIFSMRKKTDGQERSFSMLVDKDGNLRSMLVLDTHARRHEWKSQIHARRQGWRSL